MVEGVKNKRSKGGDLESLVRIWDYWHLRRSSTKIHMADTDQACLSFWFIYL